MGVAPLLENKTEIQKKWHIKGTSHHLLHIRTSFNRYNTETFKICCTQTNRMTTTTSHVRAR